MHWQKSKGRFWLAIDNELWPDAVSELADVSYKARTRFNYQGRLQGGIDDANVRRVLGAWCGTRAGVEMRLTAEVQGNVLLGDEASADAGAEVLV